MIFPEEDCVVSMQLQGRHAALFTNDHGKIVQSKKTEIIFNLNTAACRVALELEGRPAIRPSKLFLTFPTVLNSYSNVPVKLDQDHPLNATPDSCKLVMIPEDHPTQMKLLERYSSTLTALFAQIEGTRIAPKDQALY